MGWCAYFYGIAKEDRLRDLRPYSWEFNLEWWQTFVGGLYTVSSCARPALI